MTTQAASKDMTFDTTEGADVYAFWRAACRDRSGVKDAMVSMRLLRTTGDGSDENPQPGLWAVRQHKGARRVLARIYLVDDAGFTVHKFRAGLQVRCIVNGKQVGWEAAWPFGLAVSKEEAAHYSEHGYWSDEPPPIGHNAPPSDDPYEALKLEIEAKQKQAEDWIKARPTIMTQVDANLATNMQRSLLAVNKRADAMFTTEKAPYLEAGRVVDERYRFRGAVADVAERLRKIYGRFMADDEARQKTESAAKLKAEQDRIAAAREKLKADDPIAFHTSDPELPLAPEPVKVQTGGGVGNRAGLKDVWIGTVTDYREAALFFIEHSKLRELIDKLVAHQVKDMKAATRIPGVTVAKERRAT